MYRRQTVSNPISATKWGSLRMAGYWKIALEGRKPVNSTGLVAISAMAAQVPLPVGLLIGPVPNNREPAPLAIQRVEHTPEPCEENGNPD